MFENFDTTGWMIVVGCLLLGFCVVYFIMDKPTGSDGPNADQHTSQASDSNGASDTASNKSSGPDSSNSDDGWEQTRGVNQRQRQRHWSEVLDVPAVAHIDEIKAAYRRKMAQYHPDKVAALGPELREVADKLTKEINTAYDRAKLERG